MEQLAAGVAAMLMLGSLLFESNIIYGAATLASVVAAAIWLRRNAPHDHWKGYKRHKE